MRIGGQFSNNAFQKVRITKKKRVKPFPPNVSKLFDIRNKLLTNNDRESEVELQDENIYNLEAEINLNLIKEHFPRYSEIP